MFSEGPDGKRHDAHLHKDMLNNPHADRALRDSYPDLLASIGLHDLAAKYRKKTKVKQPKSDSISRTIRRTFDV